MEILPVGSEDLLEIKNLRPKGWGDILPAHQLYADNDFCHSFKIMGGVSIAGIGTVILNKGTAWLAHIIVAPDHRGKGIGYFITDFLIKFAEGQGCGSVSLIATELGKPVYQKLGFETCETYVVFKGPELEAHNNFNIRPLLKSKHFDEVLNLDQMITGEDRRLMLEIRLGQAVVYLSDSKVCGYYLPQLGEGPIYAKTEEAGLELIKFRCVNQENTIVVPAKNDLAANFLTQSKYQKISTCIRMIRGKKFLWKPECVFARVGGFFG